MQLQVVREFSIAGFGHTLTCYTVPSIQGLQGLQGLASYPALPHGKFRLRTRQLCDKPFFRTFHFLIFSMKFHPTRALSVAKHRIQRCLLREFYSEMDSLL